MTNEDIIKLANQAASAAFDAFGSDDAPMRIYEGGHGTFPLPETAYEFIRQTTWEEFDGDDVDAKKLWESLTLSADDFKLFRVAYKAKLERLAGVSANA